MVAKIKVLRFVPSCNKQAACPMPPVAKVAGDLSVKRVNILGFEGYWVSVH